LKKAHKALEAQIKLIAIKLTRLVSQIKTDRQSSKAHPVKDFEKEFNALYDEQIRLQEEERMLTEKIKLIQMQYSKDDHIQVNAQQTKVE
jgi:hypothetical protein